MFLIFLSLAYTATGRDSLDMRKLHHDVTLAASAGYNLPSHGYYRGHNHLARPIPANTSLHLEYGFGFNSQTDVGALYPGVTQGVGISICTFYQPELMGTPFFAYVFQKADLKHLSPDLIWGFDWKLGGSYGWKQTDIISTKANIFVSVGLMISWNLSQLWTLDFGPEFSHCSNGDTRYPNGGANLVNIRVGLTGHVTPRQIGTNLPREKDFAQRMVYDLILYGGWRAGKITDGKYAIINEAFPFAGVNFMPMYRLDHHFLVGASLDLLADRSANITDVLRNEDREVVDYKLPSLSDQITAGLTMRFDIQMPIFTVGAGVGGFILPNGNSLKGIYSVFNLKTFLTEHMFFNIGYRLSTKNYTHNMTYGCGWRF